jgi:hypothetical protein
LLGYAYQCSFSVRWHRRIKLYILSLLIYFSQYIFTDSTHWVYLEKLYAYTLMVLYTVHRILHFLAIWRSCSKISPYLLTPAIPKPHSNSIHPLIKVKIRPHSPGEVLWKQTHAPQTTDMSGFSTSPYKKQKQSLLPRQIYTPSLSLPPFLPSSQNRYSPSQFTSTLLQRPPSTCQ